MNNEFVYTQLESPVGKLWIIASDKGLHRIDWKKTKSVAGLKSQPGHPILKKTAKQLKEYFAGKRSSFDLPLAASGTEFQKKAWRQLSRIPFGKTISYQDQARKLGDQKKARAVGMANSKNPLSIVVPCHRVVGKNGSLTGFAGGLNKKKFLLELEGR